MKRWVETFVNVINHINYLWIEPNWNHKSELNCHWFSTKKEENIYTYIYIRIDTYTHFVNFNYKQILNLCIIDKPNKHLTKWQTDGQTDKTAYHNFIELLFPFRLNGFNDVENNWIYFLFWPKFVAVRYAWKTPTHTHLL